MLVHHVLFWLKNPGSKEDREKLLSGMEKLRDIEPVQAFHAGVPAAIDRPVVERGYSVSLLLIFEDLEGHDQYQTDPIHKQFIAEHAQLWSKVVIYDAADAV